MNILAALLMGLLSVLPDTFPSHLKDISSKDACADASSKVLITAQQIRKAPPSYRFLVSNLTDVALTFVLIESGPRKKLKAMDPNIPTAMGSPRGWKGAYMFLPEESGLMKYRWETQDESLGIRPGESSCDFRIDLPMFVPKPGLFDSWGEKPDQVDFRDVRFSVVLWNGDSYCGTIQVVPLK